MKEQLVNGDAGEQSATESHNAAAETSGGSDSDISRPSSVDPTKQPSGHLRTNSVKKPTTFKSVSVTKNFLAKSAVSVPAARPGDKAPAVAPTTSSTLQTARPRLVAKSGGSNTPRSIGKMNGASSGPDASKVWNKNQPVPPAPPKQFTDEELKQQYGIHLATRLQADEAGKEAKWADIDDDEDDWTPETVQWMDGTKSTVAAVGNQTPPPEEPKPAPKKEISTLPPKPASSPVASTQKPSLTGGTKTILKPGAHAQATSGKPKGLPDKPTLVAKPSTAAPVKSPWAQLPPIEKVSPIQINPPAQLPSIRNSRDAYGHEDATPSHVPAKEIAPDDFNRSWRDDRGNRELFNSHSGRYEPVGDMRRGSIRDSGYRQQPAVLQRASHDGPAEPSPAFQTSRTSADGPGWGRRRNSSNVSGGSGRRMSFDRRGVDIAHMPTNLQRRESQSINGVDAGPPAVSRNVLPENSMPLDQQPPSQTAKQSTTQNTSPNVAIVQPASPFGSAASQDAGAGPQMQNPLEVQQRLLHDNLDTVKLRKQKEKEQEAKEEAERKERLRKKMEALGFNEELKPKPKEDSPSRAPQKSPRKEKVLPVAVQSPPPKPPVPTAEGEVAQYGMMKVHQPQPLRKSVPSDLTTSKSAASKPSSSPVKTPAETLAKPIPAPLPSPTVNSSSRDSDSSKSSPEQAPNHAQPSKAIGAVGAKPGQPPQSAWSSVPQRPFTSNVWGPPQAKDRALGNGTFGQQVPPQSQSNATPIGVTPTVKPPPSQLEATAGQSFTPKPAYQQAGPAPAQPNATPAPGPIALPAANKWGNFQAHIRQDDRNMRAQIERDRERFGDLRPELRETFVDQSGKTQTIVHSKLGTENKISQAPATQDVKPKTEVSKTHEVPPPVAQSTALQPATQVGRSSRFFPKPVQPTTKQDSPPPPETESHPAFSGDSSHPVVKMPKPSPRVRLPPAVAEPAVHPEAPVSMPPRSRVGIGARPLALTQEWQARFNSLLGQPNTPTPGPVRSQGTVSVGAQKPGALAIAASSKAPLEVREKPTPATVSLPVSAGRKSFADDNSNDITSRNDSDALLEDREFGSLPTVRLSKVPHLAANEPPVGFPSTPRQHPKNRPAFYAQSKPDLRDSDLNRNSDSIDVKIRLGNIHDTVTKSMAVKRKSGRSGGGPHKLRRGPSNSSSGVSSGQNPRSRKPSNYQGQASSSNSSPRGSSGSSWSNNRSNASHNNNNNNNPWSRRPASAAPVH